MRLQGLVIAARGPVGEAEEVPRAGLRRQVGDRLFQQLDGLGVLARPQGFVALPQRLDAVGTAAGEHDGQEQQEDPRGRSEHGAWLRAARRSVKATGGAAVS